MTKPADGSPARDRSLDVAVTGMFARFPGAEDLPAWWAAVRAGEVLTTRLDREHLRAAGVPEATLADPEYVPVRGYLADADRFDHALFGISPREAELMDPQHRLMLEAVWGALEDAGHDPTGDRLRTGVYASASDTTHVLAALADGQLDPEELEQLLVGAGRDHMAGRIAYRLGLTGPALAVLTACSSSLVAVHLAVQGLINGDCDQAVVVAASVSVPQEGHTYLRGGIYSRSGDCRPFDSRADGAVGGSGVAAVVLRRLEDVGDDPVHGVILGSAINNDGSAKAGYNAPSPRGQEAVILAALRAADVPGASLGYLEAHGTGTYVGDPIEWSAATAAYRRHGVPPGRISIGAVKATMGHLDAAAGLAALIKALHVVRDGVVPPVAGFRQLNPMLAGSASPLTVPVETRAWDGPQPRRAGVSSFGIGGTNAHVVVEQPPPSPARAPTTGRAALVVLSAADEAALHRSAARLAGHLAASPARAADVAHTLATGRAMLTHRLAVVGHTPEEIARRLTDTRRRIAGVRPERVAPLAFLLPGQGTQWPGMALPLRMLPGFDDALAGCLAALGRAGVAAGEVRDALLDREFPVARLEETDLAQPALFALEHAATTALRGLGLVPAVLAGHSLGEVSAACLAGALDLPAAAEVVAARARTMRACPPGAMLAVLCAEDQARALIAETGLALEIAAVNGPDHCVVAGRADAVESFRERIADRVPVLRLRVGHAFHTSLVAPVAGALRAVLAGADAGRPTVAFLVNATGEFAARGAPVDLDLLAAGVHATVRFGDGMAALAASHPGAIAVEIGAGRALATMAMAAGLSAVALLPRRDRETADLLGALGELWAPGQPVDLAALTEPGAARVRLPTYPFRGPRIAGPVGSPRRPAEAPAAEPAHGEPPPAAATVEDMWRDLLGHADLTDDADFFRLGGDSLVVIRLARRIDVELGVEVPIRDLVAARTLGAQRALVARLTVRRDPMEPAA